MRMNRTAAAAAFSGLLLAVFGASARAQTLDFVNAPITDVVSQFHSRFGANIVLKDGISPYQRVTFSVDDASEPGARLAFLNELSNVLHADFTKTFVVSRASDDTGVTAAPAIDARRAPVVFKDTTVAGDDAIRTVAGVDGATVQFYTPADDDITVPATHMTADVAARDIASRTHTVWKAFYALTPSVPGRVAGGRVIGRTAAGAPIIEFPMTSFRVAKSPPPPTTPATGASGGVGAPIASTQSPIIVTPNGPDVISGTPTYPGYDPYAAAYGGYGYNPYGAYGSYGGYGYNPYGIMPMGNGMTYMGGSMYGPPIVIGGG